MASLKFKYKDQGYVELVDTTSKVLLTIPFWSFPNFSTTNLKNPYMITFSLFYKYSERNSDIFKGVVTGIAGQTAANSSVQYFTQTDFAVRDGLPFETLFFKDLDLQFEDTADGVVLKIMAQTQPDYETEFTGINFPVDVIIDLELLIN